MIFGRILVLSPHTDDGEVGAGGTIAKFVESGSRVICFAFYGEGELIDEFNESMDILGIKDHKVFSFKKRYFPLQRQEILQRLYSYNAQEKIDLVLVPATTDQHQDHQVITNEALRAFKQSSILGYEIPRNNIAFRNTCFSRLEEKHADKKVDALMCYKSQIETRPDRFNEYFIRSVLIAKGPFIGTKYAEAFEVIKLIM